MGVEVRVVSSTELNQSKNGLDFDLALTDNCPNTSGSVQEVHKFTQTISIGWFSTGARTVTDLGGGSYLIKRESGNFDSDGIKKGDLVQFDCFISDPVSSSSNNGTITQVDSDGLSCVILLTGIVTSQLTGTIDIATLTGLSDLTALIYGYGLIPNSDNFNIKSLISNNDQSFYAKEIGAEVLGVRSTDWVDMIPQDKFRDWLYGSVRVRYVQTNGFNQEFEIEHIFMIMPFGLEGSFDNIINNIPQDFLKGQASLKYVYSTDFLTALSNPNTSKNKTVDLYEGSIGDLGVNLTGFDSDYVIDSVSYKETSTGSEADGLLVSSKTTVTIAVSKISGNITTDEVIIPQIQYFATEDEYTDTETTFEDNFLFDNIRAVIENTVTGSGIIKSISSTIALGIATIEIDIEYTATQQEKLLNEAQYVLTLNIGDNSLTSINSNRANLLVDATTYDLSADISDLIGVDSVIIYKHNEDI